VPAHGRRVKLRIEIFRKHYAHDQDQDDCVQEKQERERVAVPDQGRESPDADALDRAGRRGENREEVGAADHDRA
jgi:hypothetical protein